ncbi:hypothetical protein OAS86_03935 [Gammaproteobacteria bacterium]|nr:hypothetical protein [Gammaproteobacteria bacterium]
MALFKRGRSGIETLAPQEQHYPNAGHLHSVAHDQIADQLEHVGAPFRVIDVGPPRQNTIEFFSTLGGTVSILDLVSEPELADDMTGLQARAAQLADNAAPLRLVLLWDLICYLYPSQLNALFCALRPQLQKGTLFSFLTPTGQNPVRATPGRFSCVSKGHFDYAIDAETLPDTPAPGVKNVISAMPGLKIRKLAMLNIPYQDNLYEYLPDS